MGSNQYRYYDNDSLLRLQQILFYREMGLDLDQIRQILDDPDFDIVTTLQSHRQQLQSRMARLQRLSDTVDETLQHLIGELKMSEENIFKGFDKEHEEKYAQQAIDQWGDEAKQSIKLWNTYSDVRKKAIMQEGADIYVDIAEVMDKGAESAEVQALLGQWHQHLRHFYEPSLERLSGLGQMYVGSPDFSAKFAEINPALPEFLRDAIGIYVDRLRDS